MSKLKSAYELASRRVIASRYKRDDEEKPFTLDFVKDFEFPGEEPEQGEYANAFIEKDGKPQSRVQVEEQPDMGDVKMQEAETIHYDDRIREIHWNGHFLDYGGFARMNRTMVFGLSNRNVKVKVEIEPYMTHVNKATQKQLEEMANYDIAEDAPKIYGVTVPLNICHPGKKILYTMIETSEKVHPDYAGKLNLVDEIWVATEYGKKIMKSSGVYPPIHVMPLGVDVGRYCPDTGIADFGPSVKDFRFLSVFRWSYRKGYDILLRAYMEEFSADDNVSLVLVSRAVECPESVGPQKIVEDFNAFKTTIDRPEEDLPHVILYGKPIHERDMPKFYNACDAFALISRGEGFGLPYCEAGAIGLPVIASNCSGHSDFLKEDNSFLVDPDDYVTAKTNGRLARMAKLCRFYEDQVFPDFGRPAIDKVREHMRYVYENREEANQKAQKLQSLVRNNYTWGMAVDRVYQRIRDIA